MQPQQPQEQPLSVPRRTLDIEDYVDILRRHRSWILGPVYVGLVLGVVIAYLWPDSYISSGMIRVVPPQVPTRFVQTNVSEEMTQRIEAIRQTLMRRDQLLNLIQTHNLYPDDRKRLPTEDIIERMRKDIHVGQVMSLMRGNQKGAAFSVSFSYSDKRVAQKVCNDIITYFVDQGVRAQSGQSTMTTEFFRDQLEVAKSQLEELEGKIAAFRARNAGQLPEQQQALIGRQMALDSNLQSINTQMSRVNQEKLQLETQMRILKDGTDAYVTAPEARGTAAVRDQQLTRVEGEIRGLESNLAIARERYRDEHPDIQRLLGLLEMKKKERDRLEADSLAQAKAQTASQTDNAATDDAKGQARRPVPFAASASMTKLQAALQGKDLEMEDLQRQLKETRARAASIQASLQSNPGAEHEYLSLLRERDLAQQRYVELSGKMQLSSMATDLENRKQGETLEVLEQPVVPQEPYAPKREIIIFGGLFAGFALGVALASGREIRDTSLKNLKDVRAYTRLTVLGSIPLLQDDFVVRRQRRLAWLGWTAAFALGALLMAGAVVYYYTTKS